MKFFSLRKCLQYYLPVTFTLFMLVTIERIVVTDGGYDRLYGLPFAYISSSYAFSMSYDVYILAMVSNIVFYFVLSIILLKVIEKIGLQLKTHWSLVSLGLIISLFWVVIFYLATKDSFFFLKNYTAYKTTSNKLVVGLKP